MEILVGLMEGMMEEGHQFMLAKKGLEDTNGSAELDEMLGAISDPSTALGMVLLF